MEFRYLPMTKEDKQEMLDVIGIKDTEALFADIPSSVRLQTELNLKAPMNEFALSRELTAMANKNTSTKDVVSFLGAGVYDHYIPSIVDHVISKSEFYTAYTPYQPEVSQGELQAIFEFQTMISELTALPIANSSMYDGGTALAEAVNLSAAQTKRKKVLVSDAVHPEYQQVIQTYAKGQEVEIIPIPLNNGTTDLTRLEALLHDEIAGVVVQYPNFLGQIEPMESIQKLLEDQEKTMLIVSSNPLALGYLTPPGEFGADIVTGDTQVFGIPAQFGGPHCGYFATSKKLMRKVPGRLVGETKDENGARGYVLTLQAREQHIRRDKATSNICSNQALNALASAVAMSSIGKHGIRKMAELNMQKARYAKKKLKEMGLAVVYEGSFFNEFVIQLDQDIAKVNAALHDKGFLGGFDLGNVDPSYHGQMLVAVTEIRTKQEINQFAEELGDMHV
ncbi:aminomethyl-transferring glycine dehydrogenase subunit GcvPA [Oceanobacillus locisalsi]|uniref:Probable glycine dehydrogenase (decarboxylating) subunit 1 n=1 Tax=Oceanobacillus locisalsi TaxID=546107 RepID=A0ABW3NEZ0_9BACI